MEKKRGRQMQTQTRARITASKMTNSKSWQNPQRFFLGRHKLKEKAQRLQTNPNETLPEESKNKDFFQKFKLSLIFQFFQTLQAFLKCVFF